MKSYKLKEANSLFPVNSRIYKKHDVDKRIKDKDEMIHQLECQLKSTVKRADKHYDKCKELEKENEGKKISIDKQCDEVLSLIKEIRKLKQEG